MDPNVSSAQNQQDQTINRAQPPVTVTQSVPPASQQQPKNPISVSINKEGASMIMTENPDVDEDDEDEELQVAPQETKTRAMLGQGGDEEDEQNNQAVSVSPQASADVQQEVEVRPSVPEFAASSPEVEKIVEKSPDQEKPDIPKVLQDAGVTHSGPGIPIDLSQNEVGMKTLPVPFEVAVAEEEKTELHDSKHWLMGKIMYFWRRINPNLGKKEAKKAVKKLEN